MARITVEDCLDKVKNRFALVILAARRTKQLMRGAEPIISGYNNKPPVISLREIASGNIGYQLREDEGVL